MKKEASINRLLLTISALSLSMPAWGGQASSLVAPKKEISARAITVADAIEMVRLGDPAYADGMSSDGRVAQFSPNGDRFVVVLERGDLEHNTNNYSLLLFRTATIFEAQTAELLASFSSTSNRPGIQAPTWIDDHTIAFLGEYPGEVQQLYSIDCETKRLTKLTNHATNVVSYVVSPNQDLLIFSAEQPEESLLSEKAKREGIVVSNQSLLDLISLKSHRGLTYAQDLFTKRRGSEQETPLRLDLAGLSGMWLSPDGRFLAVRQLVSEHPPATWAMYEDRTLQTELRSKHAKDQPFLIPCFELLDILSGDNRRLLDSPIGGASSDLAWSATSRSVVVTGTYLPLSVANTFELGLRRSNRFVAEIDVLNGDVVPIIPGDMKLRSWQSGTGKLVLETTTKNSASDSHGTIVTVFKRNGKWKEPNAPTADSEIQNRIEVTLEEDMNTPPKICARNQRNGHRAVLMDLNPSFKDFKVARVDNISFKGTDGHDVKAGLYYPVGFVPGRRYPLVIQTHGWNPERFWVDGPYSTAFAAQPLAGRGLVVLQLDEDLTKFATPDEVNEEVAAYEGAIEQLNGLGLIDRDRVGIIGFSRTGLAVAYALTHSKYHFAAATLTDISDAGYFRYIALANYMPFFSWDSEGLNNGIPLSKSGLAVWMQNAPGFSLDQVTTPVRIEANGPMSLLFEWEWFGGLTRLGKPVDFVYLPEASHVVVKPWERLTSQQGNVDWFCFWLNGEEDLSRAKREQYTRWREERDLQMERESTRSSANSFPQSE